MTIEQAMARLQVEEMTAVHLINTGILHTRQQMLNDRFCRDILEEPVETLAALLDELGEVEWKENAAAESHCLTRDQLLMLCEAPLFTRSRQSDEHPAIEVMQILGFYMAGQHYLTRSRSLMTYRRMMTADLVAAA